MPDFTSVPTLERLYLNDTNLTEVPVELNYLKKLQYLYLERNKLTDLPATVALLTELSDLCLDQNRLNPELAAAYEQGLDAVKAYLEAKAEKQIVLKEAKLILIGEGEVGKILFARRAAW
ncbi:MAG TPA: hypothetical protein DDW52_08675 [Planctomycetaceae bacterium]|nr:hypothetical protein [Planctomycetaceae bacterium]